MNSSVRRYIADIHLQCYGSTEVYDLQKAPTGNRANDRWAARSPAMWEKKLPVGAYMMLEQPI